MARGRRLLGQLALVLAAGGPSSDSDFFLTDVVLGTTVASVRWESDNSMTKTGSTTAWILCAPA